MRRKLMVVTADLLLSALCRDDRKSIETHDGPDGPVTMGPAFITSDGLPKDARIVGVWHEWPFNQIHLMIESEEFPDVPDGYACLRFDVDTRWYQSHGWYQKVQAEKAAKAVKSCSCDDGTPFTGPVDPDRGCDDGKTVRERAAERERMVMLRKAGALTEAEVRAYFGADPSDPAPTLADLIGPHTDKPSEATVPQPALPRGGFF